ncbi:Vacuolar protein sorting-associated protein 17 [Entomortierella beljakovae]|nr:Vacuolar protein sorting-associated protein 17 [Entomortierella beljakovae]
MAQDFSDPLTSAAYASSKIEPGNDPLRSPSPVPSVKRQSNSTTKSKNIVTQSSFDPLTEPSVLKKQTTPEQTKRPVSTAQKPITPTPPKATTKVKPPNRSPHVPSFSSPSSPVTQEFIDPLSNNNGDDHEPYLSQTTYKYNNNKSCNRENQRSSIASFPRSTNTGNSQPSISTNSTQKAVPSISRRESSYDQQRVKAPQYLHITIPDTNKRGKDGTFIISAQTNMPRYKRQSYQNVTRSYLEFSRLREHLVAEHPEVIVPVLPLERSLVSNSDVHSMRLFLERTGRHPILSQDYELQMFIESEFGFLPPVKSQRIFGKLLNIGGIKFGSGSNSVPSLGDTDDEFEEERAVVIKVETKLQTVMKCLDKEIRARRDLSSKESDLATLTNSLAADDESAELTRTFKMLAKPLDGVSKASKAQVGGDATVLGSFLEYKLQHVQTLNGALDYRLSVLSEYDSSIKSTESKRKTMERLRSSTSINPDRVTDSIDDLEDVGGFCMNFLLAL